MTGHIIIIIIDEDSIKACFQYYDEWFCLQ